MNRNSIDPGVRVGHIHLKVADLDRAIAFYHGVLGFEVTQRWGDTAAFLSAGGYHHHLGLNTWQSHRGTPPPPGHTGLFHAAFLYPDRASLADALKRLLAAGIAIDERPFTPHITLGRRRGGSPAKLRIFLREHGEETFGPFTACGFTLFESVLTPDGPIHAAVLRVPGP